MNEILSLVLGSMHADMARLERVAMNLANVQTAGYKREVAVTLPFAARVERGTQEGAVPGGAAAAGAPVLASQVDLRPGTLKATGQALDLALGGPGWFEVQTEAGTAYTRQGSFRLDARGRVVTQQGYPVMGIGGEILLTQGQPAIDAAGRVFDAAAATQGGPRATPLAQLRIVQFEASAQVERLGDGLVHVRGEPVAASEGSVRVQQGFLENSNVQPMQEMVQLLQSVRHLETMQKVATSYDEMLGTSIRRLGEPS
jgi:flagellar basal-body rod protein FlgF